MYNFKFRREWLEPPSDASEKSVSSLLLGKIDNS